jgi:hypothetical protein
MEVLDRTASWSEVIRPAQGLLAFRSFLPRPPIRLPGLKPCRHLVQDAPRAAPAREADSLSRGADRDQHARRAERRMDRH